MIQIIRAEPRHHGEIANLLESVFIGEGFAPPTSRDRLRRISHIAEDGKLLVAEDADGQVAGAVAYLTHGSSLAEIAGQGEAELRLLAVRPASRTHGVGKALVKECLVLAKGLAHATVVLSTQPSMVAAQHLYKHLGFVRSPDRDWIHANGGRRLVYSRSTA